LRKGIFITGALWEGLPIFFEGKDRRPKIKRSAQRLYLLQKKTGSPAPVKKKR